MNDPAVPSTPALHWIGSRSPYEAIRLGVDANLTPEQRRTIDGAGVDRIILEGRVIVVQARTIAMLPATVGSEITSGRRRIRVEKWRHDFGQPSIGLRIQELRAEPSDLDPWMWTNSEEVAVMNASRKEAIALAKSGSSGGLDGLVLPGADLQSTTSTFGMFRGSRPEQVRLDDAWFAGARLLFIEMEPRGSYPLRLELAMGR